MRHTKNWTIKIVFVTMLALAGMGVASASPLNITIAPDAKNPASPQMGNHLRFHTSIKNIGAAPINGVIAWISLVRIDKGHEAPVDLEDWSAHKAVTQKTLASGGKIDTEWPMRLIQAGEYRVIISAVTRDSKELTPSPPVDFTIRPKPVVESARVLPVAFGIPFLLAGFMFWRWRRS